jgi:hypothetical protein
MGMSSIENCYALTVRTITTAQIHVQRRDSLVDIVTKLLNGRLIKSWLDSQHGQVSSPKPPDQLWGPPNLPFN